MFIVNMRSVTKMSEKKYDWVCEHLTWMKCVEKFGEQKALEMLRKGRQLEKITKDEDVLVDVYGWWYKKKRADPT